MFCVACFLIVGYYLFVVCLFSCGIFVVALLCSDLSCCALGVCYLLLIVLLLLALIFVDCRFLISLLVFLNVLCDLCNVLFVNMFF